MLSWTRVYFMLFFARFLWLWMGMDDNRHINAFQSKPNFWVFQQHAAVAKKLWNTSFRCFSENALRIACHVLRVRLRFQACMFLSFSQKFIYVPGLHSVEDFQSCWWDWRNKSKDWSLFSSPDTFAHRMRLRRVPCGYSGREIPHQERQSTRLYV